MPTHREVIERLVAENDALQERCEALERVVAAARDQWSEEGWALWRTWHAERGGLFDALSNPKMAALITAVIEYDATTTAVESETT